MGYNANNYSSSCRNCASGRIYNNMPVNTNSLNGEELAMAYVMSQQWTDVYNLEKGFCKGTIFPDLDKPFLGRMEKC